MYDVKSAIAQAKAVAMNWTEYEQKARVRRSAFWADVDRFARRRMTMVRSRLSRASLIARSMASRSLVHPSSDALQGREHDLDERDCSRVRGRARLAHADRDRTHNLSASGTSRIR